MTLISHGGTVPHPTDDPYTYLDNGKRRWIAPADHPEPVRGDHNGLETPEHRSWDALMMERRQKGIRPTDPTPQPVTTDFEVLIGRAVELVQEAGRAKMALRKQLIAARDGKETARGGFIQRIRDNGQVAKLEADYQAATRLLADARELESDLRGRQLRAASGAGSLRHNAAVQPLDNLGRYFSVNPTPAEPQP